jgi:hypothetical protein
VCSSWAGTGSAVSAVAGVVAVRVALAAAPAATAAAGMPAVAAVKAAFGQWLGRSNQTSAVVACGSVVIGGEVGAS